MREERRSMGERSVLMHKTCIFTEPVFTDVNTRYAPFERGRQPGPGLHHERHLFILPRRMDKTCLRYTDTGAACTRVEKCVRLARKRGFARNEWRQHPTWLTREFSFFFRKAKKKETKRGETCGSMHLEQTRISLLYYSRTLFIRSCRLTSNLCNCSWYR